MATTAQILANQANAQHSTGPVTEAGKAASSRNALTNGLYTREDYVRPEEREIYLEFRQSMRTELDPVGHVEETLASEIVGASWRLRRCTAADEQLPSYFTDELPNDAALDNQAIDKTRRSIERARAAAHSALHRALNQLRRLQTERVTREQLGLGNTHLTPLAESHKVVAALNAHARGRQLELNAHLASICNDPGPAAIDLPQTPRNAPCPCGSGEKFKRCCGRTAPPVLNRAA
jgi:hypothetical protein